MTFDLTQPEALSEALVQFCSERHLATCATLRADGSPHVVPVGFTLDPAAGRAFVITSGTSVKVHNVRRRERVALTQLDGRRWVTLEGRGWVDDSPAGVADGERRYTARYRTPRVNPSRVVIVVELDRVLSSSALVS